MSLKTFYSYIAARRWVLPAIGVLITASAATHFIDLFYISRLRGSDPTLHSGPWGDIQEWDIHIEQPPEYVTGLIDPQPHWELGTLSPQGVQILLMQSGCSEDQISKLMLSLTKEDQGHTILTPDKESLLSLSPNVRSKLYLALSEYPENILMKCPICIPGGNLKKCFSEHPDLLPKTQDLMEELCYQRNGFTYFSDLAFIKTQLNTEKERADFMRVLSGLNVVNARLLIRKDTDIEKPINYWGTPMKGSLLRSLKPLFEAEQSLPNGGSISILYLLPPLARERLYTTPLPPDPQFPNKPLPDCHWTALNFFSQTPDDRMRDGNYAYNYLQSHYYPVQNAGAVGDIVALKDKHGLIIHSSVYLADDVVFTKNGVSYAQPWVLMHIKDMVEYFSATDPVQVCYYRLRQM